MNRVELALRVLQYFPDAAYDLIPMTTEELNQPAKRPLIGGFVKKKFSDAYPEFLFSNVDDYLRRKMESHN
jgi:dTDP-4-dehydrorhamnose reductase